MTLRENIIKLFDNGEMRFKNFEALISAIAKKTNSNVKDVSKCLNSLITEGILVEVGKKSLAKAENVQLFVGNLIGNAKGFAFIKPQKGLEDFFVPAKNLHGALDGDVVQFKIIKNDIAEVVKVLKRKNQRIIGVLKENLDKKLASKGKFVVASNDKFSKYIFIPNKQLQNAKEGDNVVVEINYQPNNNECPIGRIVQVLKGSELEIALENVLCSYQIPKNFTSETIKSCETLNVDYQKELKKRVDLTNKTIFTIDGEDAKDLDDAISIEEIEKGYLLGVHIADVGHFACKDSCFDKEAYFRATSVYFPENVYPMLPKKLSNELCSLNSGEPKLALSVVMELTSDGKVVNYKIFESVIQSAQRLTYTEVFKLFSGEKTSIKPEVAKSLMIMKKLSEILKLQRQSAGALDFEVKESEFIFDDNGKVIDVKAKVRNEAHKLIENFMVLCNQVVAECFQKLEVPFVYRVHNRPIKTKFDDVLKVVQTFGANVKFAKNITPKYVQNLLNTIKNEDYYFIASKLILRGLEKAMYLPECEGHFGLALDNYCHFTSPIRRYPDLTIHRIIKNVLKFAENRVIDSKKLNSLKNKIKFDDIYELEEFVYDASNRSSERERNADEAERKVDDIYKAFLMQKKLGEKFCGIVSGVTNFGVFVELENGIEGMIPLSNLPQDDYNYDEKKMILEGKNNKFYLGKQLIIVVASANVMQGKIEFNLHGEDKNENVM